MEEFSALKLYKYKLASEDITCWCCVAVMTHICTHICTHIYSLTQLRQTVMFVRMQMCFQCFSIEASCNGGTGSAFMSLYFIALV